MLQALPFVVSSFSYNPSCKSIKDAFEKTYCCASPGDTTELFTSYDGLQGALQQLAESRIDTKLQTGKIWQTDDQATFSAANVQYAARVGYNTPVYANAGTNPYYPSVDNWTSIDEFTPFRIQSMQKSLVSMAILKLFEQHSTWQLDDDITTLFPEFSGVTFKVVRPLEYYPAPSADTTIHVFEKSGYGAGNYSYWLQNATNAITPRNIMDHTAGVAGGWAWYIDMSHYMVFNNAFKGSTVADDPYGLKATLGVQQECDLCPPVGYLIHNPGTTVDYSPMEVFGDRLLHFAYTQIYGVSKPNTLQSKQEIMNQVLFGPLGATRTSHYKDAAAAAVTNAAMLSAVNADASSSKGWKLKDSKETSEVNSVSCMSDIIKIYSVLANDGKTEDGTQFLQPSTVDLMLTRSGPYPPKGEWSLYQLWFVHPFNGWGVGFQVDTPPYTAYPKSYGINGATVVVLRETKTVIAINAPVSGSLTTYGDSNWDRSGSDAAEVVVATAAVNLVKSYLV
jgi:CubicO group peptidase (beta-lactamase class C family)